MAATHPPLQHRVSAVERDLVRMSDLAVERLERAFEAWRAADAELAARVIAEDELMDDLCLSIEEQVLATQLAHAPAARDQRLLHVARIVCVALERVGDLGSAVAELATAPRSARRLCPAVDARLAALAQLAVGSLALARDALAADDERLAAGVPLRAAEARAALGALLDEVCAATRAGDPPARSAPAVLVGRHLERVSDNASAIATRLTFLITGRRPGSRPPPPGSASGAVLGDAPHRLERARDEP